MRAKLILILFVAVAVPQTAFAEESPTLVQRWEQFTTVVKQTVADLWNRWVGTQEQPKREVANAPIVDPHSPIGSESSTPSASLPNTQLPLNTDKSTSGPATQPQVQANNIQIEEIKKVHRSLHNQLLFETKTEGREHDKSLKTNKAGVPLYSFAKKKMKIDSIPKLDIGTEPEISKQNFELPDWNWKIKELAQVQQLPSPSAIGANDMAGIPQLVTKAPPAKISPADKNVIEGRVTHEKIQKIDYKIKDVSEVDIKPFEPMSEDQVKMLVTSILFERGGRCPVVLGLAGEMASKEKFRTQALFEQGSCAKELKLHQVAFDKLSELIRKQDPEYGPKALAALATDLPPVFEQSFYEAAKDLDGKEAFFADHHSKDEIFYRMAKGAFRAGHFKVAEKFASRVDMKSSFGPSAQYVVAISQFESKEKAEARDTMEKLAQTLDGSGDTVLRGLVAGNLARMDFVNHKYDLAFAQYQKMPKDHPLWVQALIEQGWTQLALDDNAGAIGNMYSLHSPYFKVLYQPESFVVRTVGYLNICQYGDAYRTLSKLEKDYRDWNTKLTAYMSPQRTPAAVYETVKSYLRSKSNTDIEGLPYQIVREAARGKTYLSEQEAINDKSDELALYNGIGDKIRKEKENVRIHADEAKKKAELLTAKLANAEKMHDPLAQIDDIKKNIEKEKQRSVPNRYLLSVLEESQQAFGHFQKTEQTRTIEMQHKLMAQASSTLYDRFKKIKTETDRVLENNEFLRYEIFAGSGENIRYQVAGGQTSGDNRIPASVKPQHMMNWSFDGEFWEDEIGNYRSSLRNNCPKQANRGDTK